jgi:xylulokinase
MPGDLFLGLDVGTQGTKGLLVDAEARAVVARASASYGLIEGLPAGAAEQHPSTWIDAVRDVAAALFRDRGADRARVAGVGVSGQQHGLVALDDRGEVLRPAKLWCDTSTAAEADELSQRLGARIPVGYTASKVLWMARREPELWKRARTVMLPHDYVNFRLTGARAAEAGDASGTGYFDVRERRYDLERAAAIDARLPELLPPLAANSTPLSRAGAALLGLPEGIPVAPGSGDNMCSALGSGATRPGVATLSLGTSATVFGFSEVPVVDPEGLIAPFCDATGGWLPLLCVMNATGVTEEVRRATGLDHETLTARATEVEPGCGGVLWIPYLAGERVPDLPRATGSILGLRMGSLAPGVLYRAAIEGVAFNIAWGVERMRALGIAVDRVRVVGGAAKNPLWCRVLADVLRIPLVRLAEAESAALGAAIQASWIVRRERGESVSADAVACEFVRLVGEPIEPGADYREAASRFRAAVENCARALSAVDSKPR